MKKELNNEPLEANKMLFKFVKNNPILFLFGFFVSLYVFVRAYTLTPLHDEVATFFHFIETGNIFGQNVMLDANNHLINSFWGRFIYTTFSENLLLYRLLSVCSIIFYLIVNWKLTSYINTNRNRWLLFLGVSCIPWILDYFSYSRGYATAITAYLWCIFFLIKFIQTEKISYYFFIITLLLFCTASNFIYIINSLLIVGIALSYFLIYFLSKTRMNYIAMLVITIIFIFGIYPMISFSMQLKTAGALYYGSLDGFWLVTVRSLAENLLFYKEEWLKFALLFLSLALVLFYFIQQKNTALKELFKLPESILFILLLGNISAILIMASILKINYPEDRAGMYFAPIFILFFGFIISKQLPKLMLILLFFPLSLIWHLNLNTSVFSPEDRIDPQFYEKLKKRLLFNETLSVYPIQALTYAYFDRKNNKYPVHFAKSEEKVFHTADILVTKKSMLKFQENIADYRILFSDKASNHIAFERKVPYKKNILFEKEIPNIYSNAEFLPILEKSIETAWKNSPIEIEINGMVSIDKIYNSLHLVISTEDNKGNSISYHTINLRWYFGQKLKDLSLFYPFPFGKLTEKEQKLKVYLWNNDFHNIQLKNPTIKLISLN